MEDCLKLLHFHLGSQITNIRNVKDALTEAARVYVELAKLGAGLAVPRRRRRPGRRLRRLADQLRVEHELHAAGVRQRRRLPHPERLRRGRRAAPDDRLRERPRRGRLPQRARVQRARRLGLRRRGECPRERRRRPGAAAHRPVRDLQRRHGAQRARGYHDAQQALDKALSLFNLGYLPLEQRAWPRTSSGRSASSSSASSSDLDEVPEELQDLDEQLSDTYFCNFSVFQSMPDSWAIKQLFPIMPIHRLNEQPTRTRCSATSPATRTARSTSSSTAATSRRRCRCTPSTATTYYLGVFLVGAYQEILGDLHNLFGDTHAVNRSGCVLDALIKGDTVREVLDYVEFDPEMLLGKLRTDVETAVREGRVDYEGAGRLLRFYEDGLHGYTALMS